MLTKQQLQCYQCLKAYKDLHGYMPSYDELRELLGVKHRSGIHRLITGLEKRGAIERLPKQARAIRLLPLE